MLSRKSIIILVIILLVILGLAVTLMLFDKSFFTLNPASPQTNANQQQNNVPSPQKGIVSETPATVLSPTEQLIYASSRNFAERYGSFSTDSQFGNLEEVQLLATPAFKNVLAGQISASAPAKEFYGVSSRALKVKINNLNESAGQAEAIVSLQRDESKTGQNNFVFNQDLKLSLVRISEAWLVNSAVWQE